ncbi:flagellar biosynthetic protein FliO [Myxococcus sp. CA040A]|uniref:flagellar biosynthetic protein FliO n=1 Tax=Myxococcus sp. CA040A TaxID=2741738 RepID=UPI0020C60285|nr:flagellar biosynthetic protein FliO [Myxococcus sp. CA040A]
MAVLRTPLMRLSLGAALLLAPSTVLAQAPSAPAPSATASPVAAVPASSPEAQKSAPRSATAPAVAPPSSPEAKKSAPSATAPAVVPEAQKSAPPSATAPAVVPASSPEAKKSAPSATAPASADNVRVAAPPSAPSTPVAPAQKAVVVPGSTASTVLPTLAEGSTEASASAMPGAAPGSAPTPEASAASRQKTPGAEPRWEDPALEGAAAATEAEAEPESMGWMLIRTLLVLGAVVASIYLTLNVGLRRLMGLQGAVPGKQTVVTVVERLTLDPKRALFVVKAADEYLLVGGGEAGLQLLSKLDSEAVERIRAQRPQTNVVPLSPFLQKLLSRRSGGSSSQPPGA